MFQVNYFSKIVIFIQKPLFFKKKEIFMALNDFFWIERVGRKKRVTTDRTVMSKGLSLLIVICNAAYKGLNITSKPS